MRQIKPTNNNGAIQLKFSWGGKRYSFNPVPSGHYDNTRDLSTAQAIATQITNDILAGNFDVTLERYRLAPKLDKSKPVTLLALWDLWVSALDLPPQTRANHYHWTRQMLVKADPKLTDTTWLTSSKLSPRTYKDRLGLMRSCGDWAVRKGYLVVNPYGELKYRTNTQPKVTPFTLEEIKLILDGFQEHYPHYVPFVMFLMATGCRTAEAIGLRWKHVDLGTGTVTISESMPKDLLGNGYKRVRKTTKTNNIRCFTVPPELLAMLTELKPTDVDPDELIFLSPQGTVIDADNFRSRQWAKVLEAQGVPYRRLYTTRHTFVSHAIENGVPITGLAYLVGHRDTSMIVKTYGHMVNRPELPQFF